MNQLTFNFLAAGKPTSNSVRINELIIAGWTGRNPDAVEAHIRELEALGISRPKTVPVFYRVSNSLLTTGPAIQVAGTGSTGEAECVVLQFDDGLWIGTGSDMTDRILERTSITLSKQACPKPIAPTLWRYEDVAGHWDDLLLRSFATINGERRLYQEGSVSQILAPETIIKMYSHAKMAPGSAMFCGTLPTLGEIEFATRFEIVLEDPHLQRSIEHGYEIISLPINE